MASKELFIVVTTGRTGSTYFNMWLNSFKEIRCHQELLAPNPAKDTFYHFTNSSLTKKILRNLFGDNSGKTFKNNPVSRHLLELGKDKLSERIANFIELKDYLSQTEFKQLI